MAEWKEHAVREPVFGRLNDLDETQDLPNGLRTTTDRDRLVGDGPGVVPSVQDTSSAVSLSARPGGAASVRVGTAGGGAPVSNPGDPGASLRAMREACELDVATLAVRTRLSRRIIDNLEHNRFEGMPPAYVRGYFRAVARELDCQADAWIQAYEALGFSDPVLRPTVQNNTTAPPRRSGRLWYALISVMLLMGLGLAMVSWTLGSAQNPLAPVVAWVSGVYQDWMQPAPEPPPAVIPDASVIHESPVPGGALQETPPVLPRVESSLADTQATAPLLVTDLTQEPSSQAPTVPAETQDSSARSLPMPPASAALSAMEPPPPVAESPVPQSGAAPAPPMPRAQPEASVAAAAVPDAAVSTPAPIADSVGSAGSAASVQPAEVPAGSVAPPPGSSRVALIFNDTSWVEIRSANDRVALTGIFHAGEQREVTVTVPARIVLGNAPGVELRRDGRPLGLAPMTRADNTARFTLEAQ